MYWTNNREAGLDLHFPWCSVGCHNLRQVGATRLRQLHLRRCRLRARDHQGFAQEAVLIDENPTGQCKLRPYSRLRRRFVLSVIFEASGDSSSVESEQVLNALPLGLEPGAGRAPVHRAVERPMRPAQVRRHQVWIVEVGQCRAGMSGTGIEHGLCQPRQLRPRCTCRTPARRPPRPPDGDPPGGPPRPRAAAPLCPPLRAPRR